MRALTPLTVALLLLIPLVPGAAAGEDPYNQDCEGVILMQFAVALLCAGADAGTNGDCDNEDNSQPFVTCSYTYGWNLNASSAEPLPGAGRLDWSYEVTACIDQDCTLIESGEGRTDCAWTVNEVEPCWESAVSGGEHSVTLELGQCVVVTARVVVSAEAWSPDAGTPLFQAEASDDSENGGASCYLDNGR